MLSNAWRITSSEKTSLLISDSLVLFESNVTGMKSSKYWFKLGFSESSPDLKSGKSISFISFQLEFLNLSICSLMILLIILLSWLF